MKKKLSKFYGTNLTLGAVWVKVGCSGENVRGIVGIHPEKTDPAVDKKPISYVSNFRHSLDVRNRVTIPSSWRVDGDDENYYLAWPHPEGCIAFFTPEMQTEIYEKIKTAQQSDVQTQALLREIFGNAAQMGCDKQGRVLLPENLCKHAGIDKDVVLVGLGRNFQIWSAERWAPPQFNMLEAMRKLGI